MMKIIRIILSIVIVVVWVVFTRLAFGDMLPLPVIFIRVFIIPIYLLLFYYLSVWRITTTFSVIAPRVIHTLVGTGYFFFVAFFISFFTFLDISSSEEKKYFYPELLVQYNFANQLRDNIERDHYASYLDKYFPDKIKSFSDDGLYDNDITLLDFSDIEKVFMKSPSLLPSINPTMFYNLDEKSSLKYISTLIFKKKFFAARLLLYHHKENFGPNEKIEALLVRVNEYIDSQGISFEEERLLHLDEQLERLYQVLTNPDFHQEDIIAGHRIIQAFYNSNYTDTVTWLWKLYQKKHDEMIFYAGDVRMNLVQKTKNFGSIFVESREDGDIIWSASKMSGVEEIVYFKNLDLVSLKKDGTIKWHINTKYAMLKGTQLYLTGTERGGRMIIYAPHVVSGTYPDDNIPLVLDTTITPYEARRMVFTKSYVSSLNFIDLITSLHLWKKHYLSLDMLYESILNLFVPFMIFAIGGYIVLYIVISSFLKHKNGHYISSDILVPVVLATSTIPIQIFLGDIYRKIIAIYETPYDGIFVITLVFVLFVVCALVLSALSYEYKKLAVISQSK